MRTESGTIFLDGILNGTSLSAALGALHALTKKQGYTDIRLDFSRATMLHPRFMVPFITACRAKKAERIDFDIALPSDQKMNSLMHNANWCHHLDPAKFDPRDEFNENHLSAIQFTSTEAQTDAADKVIDRVMRSIPDINRNHIKALEWAINEVMDNVLNHSESNLGGIVQATLFSKRKTVDIYVCDAGIGIPNSLRKGHPEFREDPVALDKAIREGVTRNKATNQGNGLFGTFKCCEVGNGQFEILSGWASLSFAKDFNIRTEKVPFTGTMVRAEIKLDHEDMLEKALIFGGRRHTPGFDFIERKYEASGDEILFRLKTESPTFGSRPAGAKVFQKLKLISDSFSRRVIFDFEDIPIISSSFADEVFGKMFVAIGPLSFANIASFRNVDRTVRTLIDRAIAQRAKTDL